ncbi:MAG: histidine phosphatase family protein [Planctomycetes bacterium]|nr:histidine phosphatase family protein [Planctomycetota bacterium]
MAEAAAKMRGVFDEPTDFCRLFLFRHPELDPAHAECAVGSGPADLSRRGRAQVLRWLELMKPIGLAGVFSSAQPQCQGPARGLAESKQLDAVIEPRLRDQEMGRWQGRTWADVMREESGSVHTFFSEFGEAQAPGGESLGDAVERILGWWAETMPGVNGKALALVLPGSLLTGFAAAMLGMRLSRCVSLHLPHGGLGVMDVFQNGVRIGCWNPDAMSQN